MGDPGLPGCSAAGNCIPPIPATRRSGIHDAKGGAQGATSQQLSEVVQLVKAIARDRVLQGNLEGLGFRVE